MSDFDLTDLQLVLQELAPAGRTALLPALHAAQSLYGYISEPIASAVSKSLHVPLADVFGVIDFYSLFYRDPVGKKVVRVCGDPACALAGAEVVFSAVRRYLNSSGDGHTQAPNFTVERAPCLGLCEHAPAALVGQVPIGDIDPAHVAELVAATSTGLHSILGGKMRLLTVNCGKGYPTSLSEYEAGGGYAGLRKALQLAPATVIAEVKASGLVGRGGAAFPTGLKWEGASIAIGEPKYVVCNADESEPGTFKDRVLLEEDPQRIIEGMLIAGYAIGAQRGYIFVRGEYPRAYQIMAEAIEASRASGYLGENILGSDFTFDIEPRLGAGAYVCGEETALFEAIEGKRGFPRVKPPFPTTHGLFGKPTVINNVETLCNVPYILANGASAYRQFGTDKSPGPKLFCVSGDVAHPGLYEVPFGITLRELLYDLAGGIRSGAELKAILFGGAAGAFATPDQLDVRMSFEDLRAAGLPLGSGVVMVFDQSRDLRDVLVRLGRFFAHESCGKCYPCQMGTQRQFEVLERISRGEAQVGDMECLADVGWTMTDSSLCGLGQTAATAVLSAMKLWPGLFLPSR
jgi:NADH-quinone oxidoreductase subunit F